MWFLSRSSHDALMGAWFKIESSLREQLAYRDSQIEDLRDELVQARAKIERMEIVLMPLSSRAGAQLHPSTPRPLPKELEGEQPKSRWEKLLRQTIAENERLDKEEAAAKAVA